jgi:hypothetical protein
VLETGENDPVTEEMLADALFPWVEVNTTSKLDDVAEACADLWFYSNAVFVNVR